MSQAGADAAEETYTVYVQQATPQGWHTVYTYPVQKGMVLPVYEALRAARDFVSETYSGQPVDTPYQVLVCDGDQPEAVLTLQLPKSTSTGEVDEDGRGRVLRLPF